MQDEEEIVKKLIEDLKQGIEFVTENEEACIVLGNTKQGKSTFCNYICGFQLSCKKKKNGNQGFDISVIDGSGLQIGNTRISQTSKPQLLKDKYNQKKIYWDSPGFYDTKGVRQQIMNGFYIQKVFEKTKKPKVILVVSYQTLGNQRAGEILQMFPKLKKIFPNLQTIKNSVCLVFTKVPYFYQEQDEDTGKLKQFKYTVQVIKTNLKEFIDQVKKISSETQDILKYFSNEGHIQIFYQPKENQRQFDRENAQNIYKGISKVSNAVHHQIEVIVSEKAKNTLLRVGREFNKKIKQECKFLNDQIIKILKIVLTSDSVKTCQQAKNKIMVFLSRIRQIKSSKSSNQFNQNLKVLNHETNKIVEIIISQKINRILKSLYDYIQIMLFLQKANKDVEMNFSCWRQQFNTAEQFLETLKKPPSSFYNQEENNLQVRGHIIGFTCINKILKDRNIKDISMLKVFSTCCLYLDDKITLPGASVAMISRNWVAKQDIGQIILNAKQIQDYKQGAKNGNSYQENGTGKIGEDGIPGKAGNNGGIFFGKIIGHHKQKQIRLSLHLNGSNGGKGQDGGNGMNGKQVPIQQENRKNIQKIKSLKKQFLIERDFHKWKDATTVWGKCIKILKGIVTFNEQFKQIYQVKGQEGNKGGDAGKGGKGGKPGHAGIGKLFNGDNNQLSITIKNSQSKEGQNGKHGQPGKGTQSSSNVKGIYMNQIIFSVVRSDSQIIKQQQTPRENTKKQKQKQTNVQRSQEKTQISLQSIIQQSQEKVEKSGQQIKKKQENAGGAQNESRRSKIIKNGAKPYHGFRTLTSGGSGVLTGLKLLKNGISYSIPIVIAAQTLISGISASASSGWIKQPYQEKGSVAENGVMPTVTEFNQEEQQQPKNVEYFTQQQRTQWQASFFEMQKYHYYPGNDYSNQMHIKFIKQHF